MSVTKILVLEDDECIATDIQQRLLRLNYAVCEVVHSRETLLARLEALRPDLVIMGMSQQTDQARHESMRHLLEQLQIPILYSTMHTDRVALQSLTHKEPFCYVRTPLDDQDLHRTITMALLCRQRFDLGNREWPIRTEPSHGPPASLVNCHVDNAMIGEGTRAVDAFIRHSVIGRNVRIEPGAQITDSVIFDNTRIGANAHLTRVIVDRQ